MQAGRCCGNKQQLVLTFGGARGFPSSLPPAPLPFAIALPLSPRWRQGRPPLLAPLASAREEDPVETRSCCAPSSIPVRILELYPAALLSGTISSVLNTCPQARLFSASSVVCRAHQPTGHDNGKTAPPRFFGPSYIQRIHGTRVSRVSC